MYVLLLLNWSWSGFKGVDTIASELQILSFPQFPQKCFLCGLFAKSPNSKCGYPHLLQETDAIGLPSSIDLTNSKAAGGVTWIFVIITRFTFELAKSFFRTNSYVPYSCIRRPANCIRGWIVIVSKLKLILVPSFASVLLPSHPSALIWPFALPNLNFICIVIYSSRMKHKLTLIFCSTQNCYEDKFAIYWQPS